MARLGALGALAFLCSGCTELPDVERYACGNRVVEPEIGEECDGVAGCGAVDSAHPCGWMCDEASCPAGYACGSDFACRQPTETFFASSSLPMATRDVSTDDMDGDGARDLLGYDNRGLVMRFGDWDGLLTAETRVPLPIAGLASCTGDVDFNNVRDLAVPIGGFGFGLFVGDGARGLTPVAQSAIQFGADAGEPCDAIVAGNVDSNPNREPQLVIADGRFVGFLDDPDACMGQPDCLLSVDGGAILDGKFSTATLGYGAAAGVHAGEQFTLGVVGQASVSVWGEALLANRPKRLGTWVLPEPFADNGHVTFAQLDADGCPDLLVDTGTSLRIAYSTSNLGNCTGLGAALTAAVRPDGKIIGLGDLDGLLDGDPIEDLLVALQDPTEGFWAVARFAPNGTPGQWDVTGLIASGEEPRAAVVLDYNKDNLPDIALTVADSTTVDFYMNYLGAGYSRFPVDVGGKPRAPQVGDFDGDLHEDVVVVVPGTAGQVGRDQVMILYGDPSGRPVGPQLLGSFVADANAVRVQGGLQPFSDSVLVLSNQLGDGEACDRRLAILIGDTSRQLVSPYVLTFEGSQGVLPIGIADVSAGSGVPRMLAVGIVEEGVATYSTVISVLGFEDGEFAIEPGMQKKIPSATLAREYFDAARWRTGDLDADGVAEAVAVAGSLGATVSLDGEIDATPFVLDDQLASPPWIDLVDLDGDGDLDLVGAGGASVVEPADTENLGAAAFFWVMDNDGGTLDTGDPSVLAMPDGLYCYDAATITSRPDLGPQLAALCYVGETGTFGVAIGTYDPTRSTDTVLDVRIIPVDGAPQQLEIADLTGDGLADLALFTESAVTIYRQCRADEFCFAAEAL